MAQQGRQWIIVDLRPIACYCNVTSGSARSTEPQIFCLKIACSRDLLIRAAVHRINKTNNSSIGANDSQLRSMSHNIHAIALPRIIQDGMGIGVSSCVPPDVSQSSASSASSPVRRSTLCSYVSCRTATRTGDSAHLRPTPIRKLCHLPEGALLRGWGLWGTGAYRLLPIHRSSLPFSCRASSVRPPTVRSTSKRERLL